MEDKYKYQCCYCGRKFIAKLPHRCNTGFRKRHHKWINLKTMEVEGMKANELMIGDWVMYRNSPKKVVYINDRPLRELHNNEIGFTHNDDEWIAAHNATPISLTEKIMKANGFDIVQSGDTLTIWKQKDDEYGNEVYDITIYASKGKIYFDTSIRYYGAIRKNIRYVHELQHALRLCGLTELADNFKVE